VDVLEAWMSVEHEPHRCYRGHMCLWWEEIDGKKQGGRIEAEKGLCEPCRTHLFDAVGSLTSSYEDLAEMLLEPTSGGGEKVTFTRELPVPLRLSIEALQAEMVHVAWTWAEIVARVVGTDGKTRYQFKHTRPQVLLADATKLLRSRLSVFLAVRDEQVAVWTEEQVSDQNVRPLRGASQMVPAPAIDLGYVRKAQWDYEAQDGVDGAVQMIDLYHRARRTLGVTRAVDQYQLPCPRCQGQLTRLSGPSDLIECGSCDFKKTIEEYEQLCLLLARRRGA
jgi:hypothetical protein